MTLYEKIKNFDIENMAAFIYEIITTTEDRMLDMAAKQGVDASIVRMHPDLEIARHVLMLSQEAEDGDT